MKTSEGGGCETEERQWLNYAGGRIKRQKSPRKSLGFWVRQLGDRNGIAMIGEARNQGKVRSSGKTILS